MRLVLALLLHGSAVYADAPEIVGVSAVRSDSGWRFDVTLRHPDTGWEHYADGWRVETADGTVLGQRDLLHPHVSEQPFTRALSGIVIDEGTQRVLVRARCTTDGWAAQARPVLPGR